MFINKEIDDIIKQVQQLARTAPEPRAVCWIVMGSDECAAYYCPECADLIVTWLRDGGVQPEFDRYERYPLIADMNRDDNFFSHSGGGYEFEGSCCCEHCGHHLSVSLLEYGVESELDHFEMNGIESADDWRYFLDVCDGISYVGRDGFPGEWMKPGDVKDAKELYDRTVAVAHKYLPAGVVVRSGTLKEIAQQMKQDAAAQPNTPVHRRLNGGLRLIALDSLREHRLSLVRTAMPPSRRQIETIRRDFGVPTNAKRETDLQRVKGEYFHILRLIWPRKGKLKILLDDGDKVVVTL